jgi:hypothetical protein
VLGPPAVLRTFAVRVIGTLAGPATDNNISVRMDRDVTSRGEKIIRNRIDVVLTKTDLALVKQDSLISFSLPAGLVLLVVEGVHKTNRCFMRCVRAP